ncbi:MAG: bifunctional phosphopantothenoylcysteine decarboxylase/phosphopantothenate--cysteine ligase CoaBC [Fimbriimonadaceae bacterium]
MSSNSQVPTAVLGVSGSIAAYRAADLARVLMTQGFTVRVCLTESAQEFVRPALFEALTGQPCLQGAFEEPVRGRMAHIDWAREADLFVVAPASANTLSAAVRGEATDMLTTLMVAYDGPIIFAPAMNPTMWVSDGVRESLAALEARGHEIVEPDEGSTACGEQGQGRLATIDTIVNRAITLSHRSRLLDGKTVLITSGATIEPIDAVRYLSNRSSGKMGAALAKACVWMGARTLVVAASGTAVYPIRSEVIRVETAQQMLEVASTLAPQADYVFGAAAVADFRPASQNEGKPEKGSVSQSVDLVPNPDVISELAKLCPGFTIGFAAQYGVDERTVLSKLERKGLFAIAVNDISRADIGMGADYNELTLFTREGPVASSGKMGKLGCAFWLLQQVVQESAGRR